MSLDADVRKRAIEAAVWVTASPHEWVWTGDQQVAMARFCCWANRELDDLDLFRWMVSMRLNLTEDSNIGYTNKRWVVVDIDGEIHARGESPEDAMRNAKREMEA